MEFSARMQGGKSDRSSVAEEAICVHAVILSAKVGPILMEPEAASATEAAFRRWDIFQGVVPLPSLGAAKRRPSTLRIAP